MIQEGCILVPDNQEWETTIEEAYPVAMKITRYALKKEKDVFDISYLESMVKKLPSKNSLELLTKESYQQAMAEERSQELCRNFDDYEDFVEKGVSSTRGSFYLWC